MHALGLLATGNVVHKLASELLGQYVGESESLVAEAFDAAKGGVLFIEEADAMPYVLYGREFLHSLIGRMSSPTCQVRTSISQQPIFSNSSRADK